MKFFVGVDLGTTAVKVVLFNEKGEHFRTASEELELLHPAPEKTEQDPESWYEIPCRLIRKVTEGTDPADVTGISVSSQGITLIPVDKDFKPLYNGISWLDTRAKTELEYVRSLVSAEEMFRVAGKHMSPLYSLPKLLWLKNREPEVFSRAYKLLMPMDYFTARACGRPVTDATMAGGTMLFDLSSGSWSGRFCGLFGVPEDKLPEVRPTGTAAGFINAQTCRLTGLTEKTLIAVGAQDQKIAAYGAGIEPGVPTMSLGTAGAIEFPCGGGSDCLPSFAFRVKDSGIYVLEACINTFGAAMKWARDHVFHGMSYREMDSEASLASPGCGGVLFYPHLSGQSTPYTDRIPKSGWKNVSLSSTRGDMIRSVYEGLACEVRNNIDAAKRSGAEVRRIRAFGGGSRSDIVCRIIADISRTEVQALDFSEMSSFGAAKAAAVACGYEEFDSSGKCRTYLPTGDGEGIFERYMNEQEYL